MKKNAKYGLLSVSILLFDIWRERVTEHRLHMRQTCIKTRYVGDVTDVVLMFVPFPPPHFRSLHDSMIFDKTKVEQGHWIVHRPANYSPCISPSVGIKCVILNKTCVSCCTLCVEVVSCTVNPFR